MTTEHEKMLANVEANRDALEEAIGDRPMRPSPYANSEDKDNAVSEFVDRLLEFLEARADERACYERTSSSPAYFCATEIAAADDAREAFAQSIHSLLDDRMRSE